MRKHRRVLGILTGPFALGSSHHGDDVLRQIPDREKVLPCSMPVWVGFCARDQLLEMLG